MCLTRLRRFAVRFAAKEAALKALGAGIGAATFSGHRSRAGAKTVPPVVTPRRGGAFGLSHGRGEVALVDDPHRWTWQSQVRSWKEGRAGQNDEAGPDGRSDSSRWMRSPSSRTSESILVERAGTAVATWSLRLLGGAYGRRVVVVAGKGNNGADGRVAADRLRRRGARVDDLDAIDAPDRIGDAENVDLVVDAAYGTGFKGSYKAPSVPAGVQVLAVDIPSGIDGDTGEASGEVLRADLTVTFGALKPGLLQGDGPAHAGRVEVARIGLDPSRARIWLVEDADVGRLLPPRPREAHKWQSGVVVVAGSPGMLGAASLCARSAYRSGAGMVRLAVPGASASELPASEAVGLEAPRHGWASSVLEVAKRCGAVVVGPGIGRDDETSADVRRVAAESPVPVVVDADGLFAMGDSARIADVARSRRADSGPIVLTPHSGEFARIFGRPPGIDKVTETLAASRSTDCIFLLKGSTTVVARGGDRRPRRDVRRAESRHGGHRRRPLRCHRRIRRREGPSRLKRRRSRLTCTAVQRDSALQKAS